MTIYIHYHFLRKTFIRNPLHMISYLALVTCTSPLRSVCPYSCPVWSHTLRPRTLRWYYLANKLNITLRSKSSGSPSKKSSSWFRRTIFEWSWGNVCCPRLWWCFLKSCAWCLKRRISVIRRWPRRSLFVINRCLADWIKFREFGSATCREKCAVCRCLIYLKQKITLVENVHCVAFLLQLVVR